MNKFNFFRKSNNSNVAILLLIGFISIVSLHKGISQEEALFAKALSENQDFIVPDDAPAGENVGVAKAFPEFVQIGEKPYFETVGGANDLFEIDSNGIISVISGSSLDNSVASQHILTVQVSKVGYEPTEIDVTINVLDADVCTFFDFSAASDGDGTRANPYNSIRSISSDNTVFLFRRGTTVNTGGTIQSNGHNNILCASYGVGDLPLFSRDYGAGFTINNGSDGFIVRDIEFTTASPNADGSNWAGSVYGSAYNGAWKNIKVLHCYAHHTSGIALISNDPEPYAENATVEWNTIHDIPSDGIFIKNTAGVTNLNNNHIERVNLNWHFVGHTEAEANGDGIQTYDAAETIVKHNYIDRTYTGNKFCIIIDSRENLQDATVTDNYLIPTTTGEMRTWGVYVFFINGQISRNYFKGGAYGIYNGRGDSDITVDHNVFDQCEVGVQDRNSKVFNNVFYDNGTCLSYGGSEFKNNIVYFSTVGQKVYDYWFEVDSDNNLYNQEHSDMFGTGHNSLSSEQPAREVTSFIDDPMFASIAGKNFRLLPESPAEGKGLALGLSMDFEGIKLSAAPNIGAFEIASDGIYIELPNNLPVLDLSFKELIYPGFIYHLDASNSFDTDGESLTFNWELPDGIDVSSLNGPVISFIAPQVLNETDLSFNVSVTDGVDVVEESLSIVASPYKLEVGELSFASIEASGYQEPNFPENILDTDPLTKWSSEGTEEWVTLTLSKPARIDHIKVVYQNRETSVAYFETYGSNDLEIWEPILTDLESCGFSNIDHVFETPETKADDSYKYIKISANGNSDSDWNSIAELKAYGTYVDEQTLLPDGTTPVDEVSIEDIMEVYPNPATYFLNIDLDESSKVRILNINGGVVYEENLPEGKNTIPADFGNGVFFINIITSQNKAFTQKIIVE